WIDRPPAEIIRDQVRFTLQPADTPAGEPGKLKRTFEHIGSDSMLFFSTDYPHWHFDGDDALPEGVAEASIPPILNDNPLDAYPRLRDGSNIGDDARRNAEKVQ